MLLAMTAILRAPLKPVHRNLQVMPPVILGRGQAAAANAQQARLGRIERGLRFVEAPDQAVPEPASLAALAVGADGLHVEVHPSPATALSDNEQQLDFAGYERFASALAPLLGTPALV